MTYQEMQERLTKVETLIQAVQQPRYQNKVQNIQETLTQLNTIKENLENKMKIIAESEENMFVTTKTGGTKSVAMSRRQAMDLKRDPNVTGIETTKGKALKEGEEDFEGRNIYDLAIDLILGADNPQKSSILIVPGAKKVKIGGATTPSNWELEEFFKQSKDGLKGGDIRDLFEKLAQDLKKTKREIEKRTDKIKVEIQYGYGKQELLVFHTKFKIDKSINEAFGGEFEQKYAIRVTATLEHAGEVQEIINDNPTLRKAFYSNILFKYGSDVWATNNKDIFIQLLELIQDHYKFIEVLDQTHFLEDLDESIQINAEEGKKKAGTYAGVAVVVHMNGPQTEWKVEFIGDSKFGPAGTIVDYVDVIANLKFDDDTEPTDYMKRRDASSDYPQLEEDEMDGGAQQGQLDDEDEIFMPMGDEEDEDQTPLGHDTKTSVRKEHHDEAGMEVPTDDHDDLDIGHQDDEPHMLKKEVYDIAVYAAKLYKQLKNYDAMDGEVDFPHWWQRKVTLAREYISKAQHYLEFEEKEPMIDQLALEGKMKNEIGMFHDPKGYDSNAAAEDKRALKYINDLIEKGVDRDTAIERAGEKFGLRTSYLQNLISKELKGEMKVDTEGPTSKDIKKGAKDPIAKQAKEDQRKAAIAKFLKRMRDEGVLDDENRPIDREKYNKEWNEFKKTLQEAKDKVLQETKISKKRFKELLAEAYYEVIAEQEAGVNTDDSLKAFFNVYGSSDPDENNPDKSVNPIIRLHGSKEAVENELEREVTTNAGAGGESFTFKLKGGQEYDLYRKDKKKGKWTVQIRGNKHILDANGIEAAQQDIRILSKEAPTPTTDEPAELEDDGLGGADAFGGSGGGGADLGGGTDTGGGEPDLDTETETDTTDTTDTIATGDSELEFDTETEV